MEIRRKKYLVDVKFQSKLILTVLLLVITSVAISGIITYASTVYVENKSNVHMYGVTGGEINRNVIITSLFVVKPVLIRSLVVGGMLSTLMTIVLMLFYSHSLAGPVYHLEKQLEEMIKGNYHKELIFRKSDEFKQLAEVINRLQDKLKKEK